MESMVVRVPLPLASAAVAFHLVALAGQNLPDSLLRSRLLAVTGPYMDFFGLGQTWNMFSPQPGDTQIDLVAEIRYADGFERRYRFPELGDQPFLATYRSIPLRKLLLELQEHRYLVPDIARFVARRCDDRASRPTQVTLAYLWWRFPPPEIGLRTAFRIKREARVDLGSLPIAARDLAVAAK